MQRERVQMQQLRQEKQQLQKHLRFMQNLPGDFRDLEPGDSDWLMMLEIFPEKRKEMLTWYQGAILYTGILAPKERLLLQNDKSNREFVPYPTQLTDIPTFDECQDLHEYAEEAEVSFVYPKGCNNNVVQGLLYFFRAFGGNSRIRVPLLDEQGHAFQPTDTSRPKLNTRSDALKLIIVTQSIGVKLQAEKLLFHAHATTPLDPQIEQRYIRELAASLEQWQGELADKAKKLLSFPTVK